MAMASDKSSHIDIGSRRELFVDRDLIDKLDGARLKLHQPRPAAKVIDFDKPWEGVYCGYTTVFQDGEMYRMFYLGYPIEPPGNFTCYAESKAVFAGLSRSWGWLNFRARRRTTSSWPAYRSVTILRHSLTLGPVFLPLRDTRP